jgi:E3 ubiquitin-protein ligase RNF14
MDDGPDAAEDERATELATITAIFPELVTDPSDPFSASLDIPVTPAKPLPILFPPVPGGAQPATLLTPPSSDGSSDPATVKVAPVGPTVEIRYLSHLPPLLLNITLPPGYPANAPPIVELQSQSAWLPDTKLKELKDSAAELWGLNGCNQVVYDYIDSLQQAAEVGFDLVQKGGGALEISQDLELALLDFDLKAKRAKFEQETFDCGVCLGMLLASQRFAIARPANFINRA